MPAPSFNRLWSLPLVRLALAMGAPPALQRGAHDGRRPRQQAAGMQAAIHASVTSTVHLSAPGTPRITYQMTSDRTGRG